MEFKTLIHQMLAQHDNLLDDIHDNGPEESKLMALLVLYREIIETVRLIYED